MLKHAGTVPDLPADMAEQHDHYIHGQTAYRDRGLYPDPGEPPAESMVFLGTTLTHNREPVR